MSIEITTTGDCSGYTYLQVDADGTIDCPIKYRFRDDLSISYYIKGVEAQINTAETTRTQTVTSESLSLDYGYDQCTIKPVAACLYPTDQYDRNDATGCLSSPSKLTGTFTVINSELT